jgi:hypothetical protein
MRHFLGPVAFVVAIVVGIGVTYLVRSRQPAAPTPPPEPAAPAPPPAATRVTATVPPITLDRAKRQATVTLELAHEPGAAPPDAVWVTVYFFSPSTKRVRPSEPIRVKWPTGSTASVTVPATWVGTAADPGEGYLARVDVTLGPKPAVASPESIDTSPTGATPVVVLGGVKGRR